jgi:hypothetical protein
MEYPAFSFSRNGGPAIESIPAGIPLSNGTGYTAADIDGIERLYSQAPKRNGLHSELGRLREGSISNSNLYQQHPLERPSHRLGQHIGNCYLLLDSSPSTSARCDDDPDWDFIGLDVDRWLG